MIAADEERSTVSPESALFEKLKGKKTLADHIFNYCREYANNPFNKPHLFAYLDEREVAYQKREAVDQLGLCVQYTSEFKSSILGKDLHGKSLRVNPYHRRPLAPLDTNTTNTAAEDDYGNPVAEVKVKQRSLKRTGSHIKLDLFLPPSSQLVISHTTLPPPPVSGGELAPVVVDVQLPDNNRTLFTMKPDDTVLVLRAKIAQEMLRRYPTKRPEDVPLNKLTLKTQLGWTLCTSDVVADVVQPGALVVCWFDQQ